MNRLLYRHTVAFLVALILLFPMHSFAADKPLLRSGQGMSHSLFDPAVDTKGHFTMDGSAVLPHLSFSLGLMLDFGFNNWVSVEQDGLSYTHENATIEAYNKAVIERLITARFIFNFGLLNRLAVGLQIPIVVPTGTFYQVMPQNTAASIWEVEGSHWSSKGSFGDIGLHVKASVFRSDWHPVGLAFIAQYLIPSGKSEFFSGEPGGGAFVLKAIFDAEPALWYRLGLNVGVRLPLGAKKENYHNWNESSFPASFPPPPELLLFEYGPMLYFGLGQSFNIWENIMDFVVEVYGNHMINRMSDLPYLSLEANAGFKVFIEESSYLMAGYAHGIPTGATDSNYGFQSMEHRFFLGFSYEPSIPIRIKDTDMDRDGDGIPDHLDDCPDEPGPPENNGCPESDMDGDGVPDHLDKCPLVPGDPANHGCPKAFEASAEAEVAEADPPPPPPSGDVVVANSSLMILKKVNFETASDKILPESFGILDEVAKTIQDNPQLTAIEVQGHADERGSDNYNLGLTKRRAAAVRKYLIDKGVDRGLLKSQGYGEYCPLDPASNEEAWEKNRRVEFKIVEINGKPTGVKCGCAAAEARGVRSAY